MTLILVASKNRNIFVKRISMILYELRAIKDKAKIIPNRMKIKILIINVIFNEIKAKGKR